MLLSNSFHTVDARGFTLIEITVALAILGGGMILLVSAYYSAMQLHILTTDEVDSRMLMENAVGRADIGVMSGELSGGGNFGPRFPEYTWSYSAQPMANFFAPHLQDTQIYQVTATLHVPGGEDRSLDFFTFSNPDFSGTRNAPAPVNQRPR